MGAHQQILYASEQSAARLLDMRPAEFRALVDAGALPPPTQRPPAIDRGPRDQGAEFYGNNRAEFSAEMYKPRTRRSADVPILSAHQCRNPPGLEPAPDLITGHYQRPLTRSGNPRQPLDLIRPVTPCPLFIGQPCPIQGAFGGSARATAR